MELKIKTLGWVLAEKQIRHLQILFTSGCFDLFHPGHVDFLNACEEYRTTRNSRLVVGLNSDESMLEWKGRPSIVGTRGRLIMLSLHPSVDYIITFDEPNPEILIRELQPTVILHGHSEDRPAWGPKSKHELDGFEGKVVRLPVLSSWSTTLLIEKIQELHCDSHK